MEYEKIPDYVREEIEKYKAEKEAGFVGINTLDTIYLFINMAKLNNRITNEEADEIRKLVKNI